MTAQPSSLLTPAPSPPGGPCASCDGPLSPVRVYQCEGCQERYRSCEPNSREPHLAEDGSLRIPFGSDKRFHWWAGGQDPLTTVLELGATPDQAHRYADRPATLGTIRKVSQP